MASIGKTPFGNQVTKARIRYEHVGSALASVERLITLGDMDAALNATFELAFQSEKLALQARLLPAASGKRYAKVKLERQLISSMPIHIGLTEEGWFGLRFPALLPKKEKGSSEYIRHSLYLALGEYFKKNDRVRFRDCVLVIRHVYSERRPERQWRDHDNIEVNAVVDAVALYVLRDDNAKDCSHFYCSASGELDETHLFVIPKDEFVDFYPNAETNQILLF